MYTFRIKAGSKLEELLGLMTQPGSGIATKHDARAKGYGGAACDAAWALSTYADNFQIVSGGRVIYVDVTPQTIIQSQTVQSDVVQTTSKQAPEAKIDAMLYPDVPVIRDPFEFFRKPSWYSTMKTMVQAGRHIALAGPPGIGKSTAVEQLAAEEHVPLVNISADNGLRRRDLVGTVELVNSHTTFQVAEYVAACQFGWWVKVDEANAAEPDALMFLNSQIAPPYSVNIHGRSVPVHPNFRLFITYNPGLVGTKPLPDSFKDRFFPIKLGFPTDNQLRAILTAHGMPDADWTKVVVAFGRRAWELHERGNCRYQITPHRLMDAVLLMEKVDGKQIVDALEESTIATIDNTAEANVLKRELANVNSDFLYGRL